MLIQKTSLPKESALNITDTSYDYLDSYEGEFYNQGKAIEIEDIVLLFFSSGPKWIEQLFTLRNRIVGLFGLKTSEPIKDRQHALRSFRCEPGETLGLFKVFYKSPHEVILGEDDKHLNFRVSLLIRSSDHTSTKLIISTVVTFNNRFGKIYFLPVRPFHKLIVPAMMRGLLRKLGDLSKQIEQ